MNLDFMRTGIYKWVRANTPSIVNIIWSEQGDVRPARPYIKLRLVTPSAKPMGQDSLIQRDPNGTYSINGPRKALVAIDSYGDGGLDILVDLRDSLDEPDVIEQLNSAGLAVIRDGDVQNLTELLESTFETRAHFDIEFGFNIDRVSKPGIIEKVGINGQDIGL